MRSVQALSVLAVVTLASLARGDDNSAAAVPDEKQACIAGAEQGQSQRDDGKYRAARASFLTCAQDRCPRVIAQSCTKWLRELDESAPTIVLSAKDEQGADLTDVRVTFDGVPFATQLDGNPIEADTGEHVLRFERDGNQPVEQKLLLRAGEKARVVAVTMKSIGSPDQPAPSSGDKPEPPPAPEATLSAHHVLAGTLGIGAIAAAGVGLFFYLSANRQKTDAQHSRSGLAADACTGQSTPQCQSLDSAVTAQYDDQNLSTILFAGAGALAAGAIVTWLVWPKSGATPPQTTGAIVPLRSGAALQLSGAF